VSLCVNHGGANHNRYTQTLAGLILHGKPDTQPGLFPLGYLHRQISLLTLPQMPAERQCVMVCLLFCSAYNVSLLL